MQRLLLLGLNHATAPLEVRERLAFTGEQCRATLLSLKEQFPETEAVLLSTCNRVELYIARPLHANPRAEHLIDFLSQLKNVPADTFKEHLYHKSEREVITHLFSVTSSLNSMVIGETQIVGQVREAYECSQSLGLAASAFNPLFQRALSVGKQVMTDTKIAEGRISVGSVAVDCAKTIFDNFTGKTVLTIGAGKMASLVLQGFAQLKPKRLLITNRDPAKAKSLASRFDADPVAFEHLDEHLVAADIVISSTSAPEPIVTRQRFEHLLKLRRYRPIFFIDIALPRDIDPAVGKLENVYLYNLDDLQHVVSNTRTERSTAIDSAEKIVQDHVEKYIAWTRAREMGPLIDSLYKKHHDLAKEELERTIGKLSSINSDDRAQLEEFTRRIVNKLLHDPIKSLRGSDAGHAQNIPYLHALEQLFHLTPPSAPEDSEETEDGAKE
jgi:glutamyl-tRNA reductase